MPILACLTSFLLACGLLGLLGNDAPQARHKVSIERHAEHSAHQAESKHDRLGYFLNSFTAIANKCGAFYVKADGRGMCGVAVPACQQGILGRTRPGKFVTQRITVTV